MCPILKLDHDDPELEREFELEYQRSLTFEQRFEMMLMWMNQKRSESPAIGLEKWDLN